MDPSDPSGNTVYVAAASGGLWKTTDFLTTNAGGPTYVPLTNLGPTGSLNISSIALFDVNNNPNQTVIFAMTGNPNNTPIPGDAGPPPRCDSFRRHHQRSGGGDRSARVRGRRPDLEH